MALLTRHSKGQILVLVALLMMFIIGVAALAIDIGRAYGVKTKLNAAVDAASLEAAEAIAQGSVDSVKIAEAKRVAGNYFSANYPDAFLGATPSVPDVTAVRDEKTGIWQVTVEATAKMPTFFAGTLGWKSLDIKASSEAVRATLDIVLVMDASNSLNNVFGQVKEQSENFVNNKNFSESDDRFGLVVFGNGAAPLVSICGDTYKIEDPPQLHGKECERGYKKKAITDVIDDVTLSVNTASVEGMKKALDQMNSLKKQSGRRVIVFFSDGAPNTLNGKFGLRDGTFQDGNLYSTRGPTGRPKWIFDPNIYNDDKEVYREVVSLPETDLSGKIPLASYNGKRNFSRLTKIYGFDPAESASLKCDANIAARNMVENVANMAREQGIFIYALGLGSALDEREMMDPSCSTYNETGTTILRRLANTPDSDTYNSSQPTGIYCRAVGIDALGPCFDKLANAILRISK